MNSGQISDSHYIALESAMSVENSVFCQIHKTRLSRVENFLPSLDRRRKTFYDINRCLEPTTRLT